jgi:hypothetical protein
LRSILESILLETMFDLPGLEGAPACGNDNIVCTKPKQPTTFLTLLAIQLDADILKASLPLFIQERLHDSPIPNLGS